MADADPTNEKSSIGSAHMDADGTITLHLRAEMPDGTIGDARLIYPPDHKDYIRVLKHLPALKPGGSCAVPPFPDSD